MKTTTIISDINHNDLVELLSTAHYGSPWIGIYYNKTEYNNSEPSDDDCMEDKCAKILLHGFSITVYDMYAEAEDDYHGNLPHTWDNEAEVMEYAVTLKDIEQGLAKALDAGGYPAKSAHNLINAEDGNFDLPQAETLVQFIIFGEEIYG